MDSIVDRTQELLRTAAAGGDIPKAEAETLAKKRKLLRPESWKTYRIAKGPKFALERKRQATDLTHEMLAKGTWKEQEFKVGRPACLVRRVIDVCERAAHAAWLSARSATAGTPVALQNCYCLLAGRRGVSGHCGRRMM